MKFKAILLFILVCMSIHANPKQIEKLFTPKNLQAIDWTKQHSLDEYVKVLGKYQLKKENKYYFEVKKLKYPISLHTKGKTVEKIYFRTLDHSPKIQQLAKYMQANAFKEIPKSKENYKTYESESLKMKLRFSAITQKLYSVEKWY